MLCSKYALLEWMVHAGKSQHLVPQKISAEEGICTAYAVMLPTHWTLAVMGFGHVVCGCSHPSVAPAITVLGAVSASNNDMPTLPPSRDREPTTWP